MDIHEYQAKQLLSKFGVNIPPGEVVYQTHEAENIVSWLNEEEIIVKASKEKDFNFDKLKFAWKKANSLNF